jgi:2-C-methyl-D-erythritol 2,4-cyclodiphosphate synthase
MIRVGQGFDAHRLLAGRRLVLGGVEIPSEKGLLGHSDGDALAHAIADAILGAAALGDLGGRFPDGEVRWKDADSMLLLERCAIEVRAAGFEIVNVDATVVVQTPRIARYVDGMRANLAQRLDIPLVQVSVKAKTSDGMGYTGDGSGAAVYAVALLETA